jgi:hypothetical protein
VSADEEGSWFLAKVLGGIALAVAGLLGLVILVAHHWR